MLLLTGGLQFLLSLLDLLGVLLLGLVAALAAVEASGLDTNSGGALGPLLARIPNSITLTVTLACVAAVALILKSVLGLILNRRIFRFLANRQALVSGQIAQRLLSRPLLDVQARSSQEIAVALTGGVSALTLSILGQATIIIAEISLIAVLFLGLLFVDWAVAFFTVIFFSLIVFLLQFFLGSWAGNLGRAQAAADIGSIESIQHALRTYREVSVTGRRGLFITRFQELRWQAAKVQADTFILNQVGKYVFEIGLVFGAGLLVAFMATTRGLVEGIAIVTVFLAASARVFPSLLRMHGALTGIRNAEGTGSVTLELLADLDRFEETDIEPLILSQKAERFNQSVSGGFSGFVPSVLVSDLSLRFPGASELALDSISLDIRPSQSVAFVGATGAGKTTLADVILGVLLPDSGSVLISGLEPHKCVEKWPGAMAYVPQDVAVLSGSVRENVALGIPSDSINDSLVIEALDRAQLSAFLNISRQGIHTLVGENGVQLSGGQRQRLGIARALYSRPKLLVLDEATSALDAETERIITETLDALAGDVTVILIAHRLATVRHCDQVIHLERGMINGRGTFEEVRAQVPEFKRQSELLGL